MTTCSEIRELLLEAAPEELRGEGEGALAGHLRACEACRRDAALLLGAADALDRLLDVGAAPDVDAILQRAAGPDVRERPPARTEAWARAILVGRRGWIPLAAAAAATAVLLVAQDGGPPQLEPVVRSQAPPTVEAAAAEGVAIIETDNPDITVLWYFGQGT